MMLSELRAPEPQPTKRYLLLVIAIAAASFTSGFVFSAMLGQERNADVCARCEQTGKPSPDALQQEAGVP